MTSQRLVVSEVESDDPEAWAAAKRSVDLSFEKDAGRAEESLREHSAGALRRRALAAQNGHGDA